MRCFRYKHCIRSIPAGNGGYPCRLATAALCQELLTADKVQRMPAELSRVIARVLAPNRFKRVRRRDGQFQPLVPQRLRNALHETAYRRGVDANAALVWVPRKLHRFRRWPTAYQKGVSADGMAKRGPYVRIASADDVRARGRVLNLEPDRVRLTFNAGTAKARVAVEKLIQAMALSVFESLAAVVERCCSETKTSASSNIRAVVPDRVVPSLGKFPEVRRGLSVREMKSTSGHG